MKSKKTLDYLQFTVNDVPDWLGNQLSYGTRSPLPFYGLCQELPCGTRIYSGNVNSKRQLVQMGGKACERHNMTEAHGRLKMILDEGGKFSRVDLAVTVAGLEPLRAFRQAVKDNVFLSARFENDEPKIITGADGQPETIYVGSLKKRSKKGVFRAYDKGKEQGTLDLLTRFELETRGKRATTAIRRYIGGVEIGRLITWAIDIPSEPWWVELMGSTGDTLPKYATPDEGDPILRRWDWLIKQVAPTLGKLLAIQDTAGYGKYVEFLQAVAKSQATAKSGQWY